MSSWGVLLPTFDPLRTGRAPQVTQAARFAEETGFDGAWAGDHLWCPSPILDATTSLAAAAAVTERIELGFSVMLLGMRPLAWAAKQIATLQSLSGGRLRLGVGVGGEFPQEYAAAEVPLRERGRRLDRALELLPGLLRGEPFPEDWGKGAGRPVPEDWGKGAGKPVQEDGQGVGKPIQEDGQGADASPSAVAVPPLEPAVEMPPLIVGGRSDAAQRRAVRNGARWMPMWLSPETLRERMEMLQGFAAEAGLDTPKVTLLVLAHVDEDRQRGRTASDAHLQGQYGMPLEKVERWTALGGTGEVAEFLHRYEEAGVDEFILMPLADRGLEQFERLAGVVTQLRPVTRI